MVVRWFRWNTRVRFTHYRNRGHRVYARIGRTPAVPAVIATRLTRPVYIRRVRFRLRAECVRGVWPIKRWTPTRFVRTESDGRKRISNKGGPEFHSAAVYKQHRRSRARHARYCFQFNFTRGIDERDTQRGTCISTLKFVRSEYGNRSRAECLGRIRWARNPFQRAVIKTSFYDSGSNKSNLEHGDDRTRARRCPSIIGFSYDGFSRTPAIDRGTQLPLSICRI